MFVLFCPHCMPAHIHRGHNVITNTQWQSSCECTGSHSTYTHSQVLTLIHKQIRGRCAKYDIPQEVKEMPTLRILLQRGSMGPFINKTSSVPSFLALPQPLLAFLQSNLHTDTLEDDSLLVHPMKGIILSVLKDFGLYPYSIAPLPK